MDLQPPPRFNRGFKIALALSVLMHLLFSMGLGNALYQHSKTKLGLGPTPEPLIIKLQPDRKREMRLIETPVPAESPPEETELIGEENSRAADQDHAVPGEEGPAVDELGVHEQLATPPPAPLLPPVPPATPPAQEEPLTQEEQAKPEPESQAPPAATAEAASPAPDPPAAEPPAPKLPEPRPMTRSTQRPPAPATKATSDIPIATDVPEVSEAPLAALDPATLKDPSLFEPFDMAKATPAPAPPPLPRNRPTPRCAIRLLPGEAAPLPKASPASTPSVMK